MLAKLCGSRRARRGRELSLPDGAAHHSRRAVFSLQHGANCVLLKEKLKGELCSPLMLEDCWLGGVKLF